MAEKISFQDLLKRLQDQVGAEADRDIVKSHPGHDTDPDLNDEIHYLEKYAIDTCYQDDDFSIIDLNKYVHVNPKQINITQEDHSQVIPFKFNRYWDGIDLVHEGEDSKSNDIDFIIHYKNVKGMDGACEPINVCYDKEYIYFHWLIDKYVTLEPGTLTFEIVAAGVHNDIPYVWRTRPNSEINILQGMTEGVVIDGIKDTWIDLLIKKKELIDEEELKKLISDMLQDADIKDTYLQSVELITANDIPNEENLELFDIDNTTYNSVLKLTLNNNHSLYVNLLPTIEDIVDNAIDNIKLPEITVETVDSEVLINFIHAEDPAEEVKTQVVTAEGLRRVIREVGFSGDYTTDNY